MHQLQFLQPTTLSVLVVQNASMITVTGLEKIFRWQDSMIPQWRNIWEMELPVLNEQPIRWEKRGQKSFYH